MNSVTPVRWTVLGAGALALPTLAQAHSLGAGGSLMAGCAHPVSGWDHLLAMVAIGLWAAQLGGRARWAVPGAFLGAMACGAAAVAGGLPVPAIEPLILTSVFVAGLFVAGAIRVPLGAGMVLAGGFAFLHGMAHAAEVPLTAAGAWYAAGFLAVTAALLATGAALGASAGRISQLCPRVLGGLVAATGMVLLLG